VVSLEVGDNDDPLVGLRRRMKDDGRRMDGWKSTDG
jgi:hypothetical protein